MVVVERFAGRKWFVMGWLTGWMVGLVDGGLILSSGVKGLIHTLLASPSLRNDVDANASDMLFLRVDLLSQSISETMLAALFHQVVYQL